MLRRMEGLKLHRIAWILALAHFALAAFFAFETPYRTAGKLRYQGGAPASDIGAPDERQHVNYVRHLLAGKGFPVLNPDPAAPDAYENYQSHQPPAFYVLAAGVGLLAGDLESRTGGLALRLLNATIGSAGVLGVYFFVLWGLRREEAARLAAVFAALLPMNLALNGAVSNDPLLFALCSWTLAFAARGIRDGYSIKLAIGTGLLMGLAFLTKTTAIALWPAVAVGLYLASGSLPSTKGRGWMTAVIVLGLPLLLVLPWWLRNQQLYGDPLAMNAFTRAFVGSPQASAFIKDLGFVGYWTGANPFGLGVGWWTLRSFFGVFGYMDIFWPTPIYAVLGMALLIVLLSRYFARTEAWLAESKASRLMGGVFFFVVLLLFVRFNAQYFQGQARYLLPAIAPIATTIALGIRYGFRKRPTAGLAALVLVLAALDIFTLVSLPAEFAKRVDFLLPQ